MEDKSCKRFFDQVRDLIEKDIERERELIPYEPGISYKIPEHVLKDIRWSEIFESLEAPVARDILGKTVGSSSVEEAMADNLVNTVAGFLEPPHLRGSARLRHDIHSNSIYGCMMLPNAFFDLDYSERDITDLDRDLPNSLQKVVLSIRNKNNSLKED